MSLYICLVVVPYNFGGGCGIMYFVDTFVNMCCGCSFVSIVELSGFLSVIVF